MVGIEGAMLADRSHCISCGSPRLESLSSGRYGDEPLSGYIERDPWGESPLLYLRDAPWDFVRCRDCEQMFHRFILSPAWQERLYHDWVTEEAMREFEEKHAVDSPSATWEAARACVRHVLRIEKMTRGTRNGRPLCVLDFGCGWGQFLSAAALFGAEAYGVDRDADRLRSAGKGGIVVAGRLEELPESLRGSFDSVSLFQVLEHLEEPLAVLESLREWLAPGGLLILETPDCTGITGFHSVENYRDINPLAHLNAFTPRTLTDIARRAGYARVEYVAAHATADVGAVARAALKGMLPRLERALRPATSQYFRRR
jgi:2-polyprenyl-3-methyl-5-hydroxy-6-metoxy-1,4-benzoquinol methylase